MPSRIVWPEWLLCPWHASVLKQNAVTTRPHRGSCCSRSTGRHWKLDLPQNAALFRSPVADADSANRAREQYIIKTVRFRINLVRLGVVGRTKLHGALYSKRLVLTRYEESSHRVVQHVAGRSTKLSEPSRCTTETWIIDSAATHIVSRQCTDYGPAVWSLPLMYFIVPSIRRYSGTIGSQCQCRLKANKRWLINTK